MSSLQQLETAYLALQGDAVPRRDSAEDFEDNEGNLVDEFMALDQLRDAQNDATGFAKKLADLLDEASMAGDGARRLVSKAEALKVSATVTGASQEHNSADSSSGG